MNQPEQIKHLEKAMQLKHTVLTYWRQYINSKDMNDWHALMFSLGVDIGHYSIGEKNKYYKYVYSVEDDIRFYGTVDLMHSRFSPESSHKELDVFRQTKKFETDIESIGKYLEWLRQPLVKN